MTQGAVVHPSYREVGKSIDGFQGTAIIHKSNALHPPQGGNDLDVDQLGRSQLVSANPVASGAALVAVIGHNEQGDACINDQHGRRGRPRRLRRN